MMNFYEMWDLARINKMDEESFLTDFLSGTEFSKKILLTGTRDENLLAISMLLSTNLDTFIDKINGPFNSINTASIVQFSTFEHALFTINKILHFSKTSLTFSELGKAIVNAPQDGACKKYGENHAKVAEVLSLVILEKDTSFKVSNSSLGEISISMNKNDKIQLAQRLALRNSFIQEIIYEAKQGDCDYMMLAQKNLSYSTALRRRSNVKQLVHFILEGTSYKNLLKNIVW